MRKDPAKRQPCARFIKTKLETLLLLNTIEFTLLVKTKCFETAHESVGEQLEWSNKFAFRIWGHYTVVQRIRSYGNLGNDTFVWWPLPHKLWWRQIMRLKRRLPSSACCYWRIQVQNGWFNSRNLGELEQSGWPRVQALEYEGYVYVCTGDVHLPQVQSQPCDVSSTSLITSRVSVSVPLPLPFSCEWMTT